MASYAWARANSRRIAALTGLGLYALLPRRTAFLDSDNDLVLDPATNIGFPRSIRAPGVFPSLPLASGLQNVPVSSAPSAQTPTLSLVGLGVRTVSFLGIKVYSVAWYADLSAPSLRITASMTPDEKIEHIVANSACLLRIIPTRTTSYTHLRDAFLRALTGRLAQERKSGAFTEADAQAVAAPMRTLKTMFPNSPLTKQDSLDVYVPPPVLGAPRSIIFRDLGSVQNTWVATQLVLYYFAGAGASPPLKQSVVARLEDFTTA